MERGRELGHKFPNQGNFDRDYPGQSKASHAELQSIVGNPDAEIIYISHPKGPCKSCRDFLTKEAHAQGREIIVIDPKKKNIFPPDGPMYTESP